MTMNLNEMSREELKALAYSKMTSGNVLDDLSALGFKYGLRAYGMQQVVRNMYEKNMTADEVVAFSAKKTLTPPVKNPFNAPAKAPVKNTSLEQGYKQLNDTVSKMTPAQAQRFLDGQKKSPVGTTKQVREEALKKVLSDPQFLAQLAREKR